MFVKNDVSHKENVLFNFKPFFIFFLNGVVRGR